MAKKHSNFKLIKKILAPAAISAAFVFTSTAFATFDTKTPPRRFPTQYHINRITGFASDYELKNYIENLSDDDLKNLYSKIFQITSHDLHDIRLIQARKIISKTQAERAHLKIMQQSMIYKLKKKSANTAIKKQTVSPAHPHVTLPTPHIAPPKPPQKDDKQTQRGKKRALQKNKAARVSVHVCKWCQQRCPISKKSVVFKCGHCGHENMKYVCENCLEEWCAKALVGKLRTHRKCPCCKQ